MNLRLSVKESKRKVVMRKILRDITESETEMIGSSRVSTKEICTKWPKFSESQAESLKSVENLSAQVAKSYNLSQAQAEADVKGWLAGRTF